MREDFTRDGPPGDGRRRSRDENRRVVWSTTAVALPLPELPLDPLRSCLPLHARGLGKLGKMEANVIAVETDSAVGVQTARDHSDHPLQVLPHKD
jgi:hypothetical protein